MEQQLLIIDKSFIRKRIKREIEMLVNKNISLEDDFKINKYKDVDYFIEFKNLKDNNYYKFVISCYYPFTPPKLYINDKSINFYHKITNLEFSRKLTKYTGIQCFCCETLLCRDNWSPQHTLNNILDDINRYRDARHQIVVRIIVDVFKRKYLMDDINIIQWLY